VIFKRYRKYDGGIFVKPRKYYGEIFEKCRRSDDAKLNSQEI